MFLSSPTSDRHQSDLRSGLSSGRGDRGFVLTPRETRLVTNSLSGNFTRGGGGPDGVLGPCVQGERLETGVLVNNPFPTSVPVTLSRKATTTALVLSSSLTPRPRHRNPYLRPHYPLSQQCCSDRVPGCVQWFRVDHRSRSRGPIPCSTFHCRWRNRGRCQDPSRLDTCHLRSRVLGSPGPVRSDPTSVLTHFGGVWDAPTSSTKGGGEVLTHQSRSSRVVKGTGWWEGAPAPIPL